MITVRLTPDFLQVFVTNYVPKIALFSTSASCSKIYFFKHLEILVLDRVQTFIRGGSRTAVTSEVELFVIIVNGSQPLPIITKSPTFDVAGVLDSSLFITVGTAVRR